MKTALRKSRQTIRKGTTAVELAFILPVFFALLLGVVQICHAQMVEYVLKSACRNAARYGSAGAITTAATESKLQQIVSCAVNPAKVKILVKNGDEYEDGENLPSSDAEYDSLPNIELASAEAQQLFLVRATVAYNDVAILSLPYCDGLIISADALMRHE